MNIRIVISVLALSVGGCSSIELEDYSCVQIGQYASSVAKMRDMGLSFDDVDKLTQVPTASFIPAKGIAYDVLQSKETPKEAAQRYTVTCAAHGSLHDMLRHMGNYRDGGLKIERNLDVSRIGRR